MDLKLKAFGNLFGQGEGKAMARGGRSMGSAALVSSGSVSLLSLSLLPFIPCSSKTDLVTGALSPLRTFAPSLRVSLTATGKLDAGNG